MNRPLFLPNWIFCIHFSKTLKLHLILQKLNDGCLESFDLLNREATGELNIIEEDFIDNGNILRLAIIFHFSYMCVIKGEG